MRPVVRSETSASPPGRKAMPHGTSRPVATVCAGAAGAGDSPSPPRPSPPQAASSEGEEEAASRKGMTCRLPGAAPRPTVRASGGAPSPPGLSIRARSRGDRVPQRTRRRRPGVRARPRAGRGPRACAGLARPPDAPVRRPAALRPRLLRLRLPRVAARRGAGRVRARPAAPGRARARRPAGHDGARAGVGGPRGAARGRPGRPRRASVLGRRAPPDGVAARAALPGGRRPRRRGRAAAAPAAASAAPLPGAG